VKTRGAFDAATELGAAANVSHGSTKPATGVADPSSCSPTSAAESADMNAPASRSTGRDPALLDAPLSE
jgi:hypothetical protein